MTTRSFERALRDWLEDGSDRTPPATVNAVLLAIKTTPQERALRIPRRLIQMPNYLRLAAAAALVAVVGAGALLYLRPSGSVGGPPAATPTTIPTQPATPAAAEVAPGITGWTPYTSAFYGFQMQYPSDWTVDSKATRAWTTSDGLANNDTWPYAEVFANPEAKDGDSMGIWVWEVPAGDGADISSLPGLKAWAKGYCNAAAATIETGGTCADFASSAVPMCLNAGGDPCRAAILIPSPSGPVAFFMDWTSVMFTNAPDMVKVVLVGRPNDFAAAHRYGGTIELLKSMLTTMDVVTPQPGQVPGG